MRKLFALRRRPAVEVLLGGIEFTNILIDPLLHPRISGGFSARFITYGAIMDLPSGTNYQALWALVVIRLGGKE